MGDSNVNITAMYKKTSTSSESINYTLNFMKQKYIHIGIDPTDIFRVAVHIITPTRYINISTEFLKRIFSLMGNILSFILEQPVKYKLFFETDSFKLSSMIFCGENDIVIESKIHEGRMILLNRIELTQIQYLE